MKKSLIGLVIALSLSSLPAFSAKTPKAGSACNKKGVTKTYKGKEFKCLKKGGKLVWSKGKLVNKEISSAKPEVTPSPTPSPTPTDIPSPTPIPSPTDIPSPTPISTSSAPATTTESTDSYITATRRRGNSQSARALSTNSAVVIREDAMTGSKAYRVKIISPQENGISFDSGIIKDYAENISFFVEGTICYVIYAHELIAYRDLDGKEISSVGRHPESPRAEFSDCPTSVFRGVPIIPGPITVPKKGVQEIYSDIAFDNSVKLRIKGAAFKSYQVSLESLLNSNVLWQSPVKNSVSQQITETIDNLSCDVRYGLRVKMWSELEGKGDLLTDVRAHHFTSLPCTSSADEKGLELREDGKCIQVGRKVSVSNGYLECRRIRGDQNAWALIEQNLLITPYSGPKESIDVCKLRDYRSTREGQLPNHSFPRPNNDERIKPSTGTVDIALVGIDFSDAPGRGKPFDQEPMLQKNFDQWVDFWSAGKLKWKWHELNEWTRVPGLSTDYNQKSSNSAVEQMTREVFTEIDKKMPLKEVEIVLIYFPESLFGTNNGYMPYRGGGANLPSGYFSPYYWGGDPSIDEKGNPQNTSWYYYHEVLHGIGFSLHAPGNPHLLGPTNIEFQYGRDYGYGSPAYVDIWSGFVNGWYDETNITCLNKENLQTATIQLESIDVNPKGQTSAMIKLSEREILVIESRRSGPYTNLPNGMAGITVTKVNTSKLYARFDRSVDGLEWEMNQWAFYARVDQEKSPEWFVRPDTPSRILGYKGESFTLDGVRVTLTDSGTFDTVKIERVRD